VRPKKLKLAVIIPKYGLVGGAEKLVQEVTERVALNPRYEIHVLANQWTRQSDRITFHEIPITTFPRFLRPISFAWFAKRKTEAMDFDLIHSHERVFHADILTMHGIPHRAWIKQVRKKRMSLFDYATAWVESGLIKSGKCRAFLPVSNLTREQYLQEFSIDANKVQVIHPGVALERFTQDSPDVRRRMRGLYGINEADTVVLFVGMNFEIKGLDILMSAVSIVKSTNPLTGIKLLVVGKGNFKKYEALSHQLGIKDDVIFAGVLRDSMESVYMASDIFSMLSKFDTFGLTVLEAMAASLPVIISNNVGARDLVKDGVNGFALEREDISAIASRIAFLLDSKERESISRAARTTATQNTWEAMARKIVKVYESVLQV
jgi:UDP-glucose:(heptosyl)LPS alpha-1,3-glucosyltransferase